MNKLLKLLLILVLIVVAWYLIKIGLTIAAIIIAAVLFVYLIRKFFK